MSCERTFEEDIVDMERLRKTIAKAVDELSFDLRKEGKLAACVAVKIRYSNFDTNTVQARVSYTASGADLTRKALELFNKSKAAGRKIRLVGVKFSDLIYGSQQIDLFNDTVADVNLNLAMDAIRKRFGFDVVKKAITLSQAPWRA
jgi:DNA polymerase-4